MKLPIANLNKAKLSSLKPFKKVASEQSSAERASLSRTHKLTHPKREKSAYQVALTLLLIRPWVLVLGLWVFSAGIGTLALGGLLSPRRLTKALPEPASNASVDSSNQSADTLVTETRTEIASAETDEAVVEKADSTNADAVNSSQLPLTLPLVLIVSSCLVGCLVISRRRAMKMASARAQVRKAHSSVKTSTATSRKPSSGKSGTRKSVASRAAASRSDSRAGIPATSVRSARKAPARTQSKTQPITQTATKTAAKTAVGVSLPPVRKPPVRNLAAELRPRRRSRSKTGLAARTAAESNRKNRKILVSRATAARPNMQSQPPQPRLKKSTLRAASRRRHPVVSVVPANESHALDWQEASLAHEMDIRSHRSAI